MSIDATGKRADLDLTAPASSGRTSIDPVSDVQTAVSGARKAQPQWAALSPKARAGHLKKVRHYLAGHAEELAEIISRDNGKTRTDAMATEVLPATMAVGYYCRKAKALLKDRRLFPGNLLLANKSSRIRRVPYGVVGIISPWNYPFSIPFSEVVNDHLMSHGMAETPWGGFKESGIGRSHGAIGMAEMTQSQCVVTDMLPGVKKNMWWHPHSAEVYYGLRGIIDLLYGRSLFQRMGGMYRLLRQFPRTFLREP